MTTARVSIRAVTLGKPETHKVVVAADVVLDDITKTYTAEALRFVSGKERPNDLCLEEAFVQILEQALSG